MLGGDSREAQERQAEDVMSVLARKADAELFRRNFRFQLRHLSIVPPHGLLVLRLRPLEFGKRSIRRRPLLRPLPNELIVGADEFVHPPLLLGDLR